MADTSPKPQYVRDLRDRSQTRQQHAQAAAEGREQRVARGAYVPTASWAALDVRGQYLTRVRAVAETRGFRAVLSHWSAAAIHGLPVIGAWPEEVHTIVGRTAGGRSRNRVIKHSLRLDDADVTEVDGLLVTSIVRTVLDIATLGNFMAAVTLADRALHIDRYGRRPPMTTKEQLIEAWERNLPFRAFARAKEVIDFAVTQADSALESVSRVNMRVIGCPPPRLQVPYYDHEGFIGDADFDWRAYRLIGEADGDIKYLDPLYRDGRTADQVVLDEKVREDRFRALKRGVTRWRWKTAIHPTALRAHLLRAGLPMGVRW